MAQGKLTPRQKMINMMYLVLTALLALNVSKEIINAFVTVNESLAKSNANVEIKNSKTYADFADAMKYDAAKYQDANTRALAVKQASEELVKYLAGLKDTLVRKSDEVASDQPTPELREMARKDNYDVPTEIMVGSTQDGKGLKASDLKGKLESYKALLLKSVPDNARNEFKAQLDALLNTQDPDPESSEYKQDGKHTWEMSKFYHNPVVASVALLTKFQGDVRNSEAQVIDYLFSSVGKFEAKMNKFNARVIPNSTVVTIGNDYKADVFLSATSTTLAPEVFVGATLEPGGKGCRGCDGKPLPVDSGIAKYTSHPGSEGEQKWGGVIRVKKPDNTFDYYDFTTSYMAQKPNSVVAADKMNVLFTGIDNPVSVSVPGVPAAKVKTITEGVTLSPDPKSGAGHFIATPATNATEAKIKVVAELEGKQQQMGEFKFRVKRVPDPIATLGGKKESGPINKNEMVASALIPVLKDFYFELYFQITSFKMSISGKRIDYQEYDSPSNQLTEQMKAALAKAGPGTKVYFEYIKAKMVNTKDQSTRSLQPMAFTLQ